MVDTAKDDGVHQVYAQRLPSTITKRRVVTHLMNRLIKSGLDSLEDCEIIELLFSLTLPYSEYKKQAKKCIRAFRSLRQVIEASPRELRQAGITPLGVLCIRLISEVPVRVLKQRIIGRPVYRSSQEVFDYLCYSMRGLKNEVFKVIFLNNRNQIIETLDLCEGTIDSTPISARKIVESAVKYRAASMIFAHNHPSGDSTPSKNDKQLTRDLVFIGRVLQIKVLDHIIIGDNSHFSFCDEGLIEKYGDNFLTLRMKTGT